MAVRLNDCETYGLPAKDPITLKIEKDYRDCVKEIRQLSADARTVELESEIEEKCLLINKLNQELQNSREALGLAKEQLKANEQAKIEANTLRNTLSAISSVVFRGILGSLISNAVIARLRRIDILDEEWYLREYRDVRDARMDPIKHFLLHGIAEGRRPRNVSDAKQ